MVVAYSQLDLAPGLGDESLRRRSKPHRLEDSERHEMLLKPVLAVRPFTFFLSLSPLLAAPTGRVPGAPPSCLRYLNPAGQAHIHTAPHPQFPHEASGSFH